MRTAGIILAAALLCGCTKIPSPTTPSIPTAPAKAVRWEYKIVTVKNFAGYMKSAAYQEMTTNGPDWEKHSRSADSDDGNFTLDGSSKMGDYGSDIYQLGQDGWELVAAVPQTETVPDAEKFHGQDF